MANVITTNLCVRDSIELFLQHWKYGKNYEDSTILIDPAYNIIAYFDRESSNIDTIMADLPFEGGYIIKNGGLFPQSSKIKYEPYDMEMATFKYRDKLNLARKEKKPGKFKDIQNQIRKEVYEYNRNYFKSLSFEKGN